MGIIVFLKLVLNFFELVACVTGFIYWSKIKNSYWKWFPVFLAIVLLTELTGKAILEVYRDEPSVGSSINASLYRYFGIPIQFLFYFWLFQRYFSNSKEKEWPLIGAAIYILSWITEMFLFTNTTAFWFTSFSYTIGNIVLLILIILFFIRFVNSEAILKYKDSMMFWVCLGLLAFYLGTFPFYALRNTLVLKKYRSIFDIYRYVSYGLDYLMYILFTIAFIWSRPK